MLTKRMLFGVIASLAVLSGALFSLAPQAELAPQPQAEVAVTGQVTSAAEGSMEGVVVTAKREGSTIAVSVISDAQGRYRFPVGRLEAGRHTLSVRAVGYDLAAPKAAEVGVSGWPQSISPSARPRISRLSSRTRNGSRAFPGPKRRSACSSPVCAAIPSIESCGRSTMRTPGCPSWNEWMVM